MDFGKNTIGYERYSQYVPDITDRSWPQQFDTPDVSAFCSKRAFDGQSKSSSQSAVACDYWVDFDSRLLMVSSPCVAAVPAHVG